MNAGEYTEAIAAFEALEGYKDSQTQIQKCNYLLGKDYLSFGNLNKAAISFGKARDYQDAKKQSRAVWNRIAVRETIAAGEHYSAVLNINGTVIAFGDNDYGQCNVSEWTDIVAISAGSSHTVGLKSDGTVVAVGSNNYGQCLVGGKK